MRFAIIRWFFSLPAALVYGFATAALCSADRLGVFQVLAGYIVASTIALWVVRDAERGGLRLPYDFGSLVFFLWPVVVPVYLFNTRGWRAFLTIGAFIGIYAAGTLLGKVVLEGL